MSFRPAHSRSSHESNRSSAPAHRSIRRKSQQPHATQVATAKVPVLAYRQRGPVPEQGAGGEGLGEVWHDPRGDGRVRFHCLPAGPGYVHAVTLEDVRARLTELPPEFTTRLEVVQFSPMTRRRTRFPCYGMQWGAAVYLYPIEETLIERYVRPPTPQQRIEARMFGGDWSRQGNEYLLTWTAETIRDFYLNNVLIHEIGHIVDDRNRNPRDRERFANWFAVEYGYRASRGRSG
jgi:hypothetical protein